jgi:hypothetical protein
VKNEILGRNEIVKQLIESANHVEPEPKEPNLWLAGLIIAFVVAMAWCVNWLAWK